MAPPKKKPDGAGGAADRRVLSKKSQRQFNAKSPNCEAQRQRIVTALRARPQSTEDLRKLGIFQAAVRVKELRDAFGFEIETARVTVIDREGYPHPRAALYSLVAEPKGGAV